MQHLKDSETLKLLQEMDDIHPGNCIRIKNLLNFYYQMSSHLQTPLDTYLKSPDISFVHHRNNSKTTMKKN